MTCNNKPDGFRFHQSPNIPALFFIISLCLILPLLLSGSPAFAETAEPAADAARPASLWLAALKYIGDNVFTFTLLLLFLTAILSSYLSRRLSDRCLKHNEGFPITLQLKDGRTYRGELDAENNGLELRFNKSSPIGEGPLRKSILLYQSEYPQMLALVCYQYALNDRQLKRRRKAINRAYHPRFHRKLGRKIRNFFAAIKDAVNEAFMLVIGRWKTTGAQAEVLRSQDRYVTSMGTQVIGAATQNSFDPLLEKLIGKRTLVEVVVPDAPRMHIQGILKEYSKDFLEVQDVFYPDNWTETIAPGEGEIESLGLTVSWKNGIIQARNSTVADITVKIAGEEYLMSHDNDKPEASKDQWEFVVRAEDSASLELPVSDAALTLRFSAMRPSDMILPRHSSIVRSRLELQRKDHNGQAIESAQ